jgi:tetratricopeptide (TPR) repeat protein
VTVSEVSTDEGNGLQNFLDDTLLQESDRSKSPQSEPPDQAPEARRGLSSINLPESLVSAVGEGWPATNFACNMPASNAKPFCTVQPFCTVRLVEVEAMVLQVRLLVRMCRWQHALESIQQLRLSLAALHLHTHMSLQECELLEGMCLAGLAHYPEAERKLRKLAQLLLHHRLQQGGAWSIAQQRVRYFQCVKAAGSIREILQDFVAASADYVESAQSWSLADHLPSQHHPFVTEASFCTTRARMRGGLLSDMHVWHQQLAQLTSALGPQHPVVSSAQLDVCEALLARGAVDEAESILLQARTALKTSCGEAHVSSARCLYLLALVYEQRGPGGRHYKEVVKMLDSALDLMLRHSSRRHAALLPVLGAYAHVCRSRGSLLLEHEVLLRRWAVEVLKDTFGQESLLVDSVRDQLVVCLQRNGRVDQARAELRNMLLSRETSDGADSISVCDIIMRLVDLELSDGHKQVDESRRHLFALQRLQQSDWQATRDEELHKLSTHLPVLEKSYIQRLQQAVKLIERSLSIKLEHQREEGQARAAKAYPHLEQAAALRMVSAVSGGQEAGHYGSTAGYGSTDGYPLEACPELQRLGQVYGALGDIKEAQRVLTSAIALCQREVQEARQAKRAVVPGHTRQEAAASERLSKAVLLKAETQRILAAMLAEAAGMSLAPLQAGEHARAAETLYAEALAAVSLELGPQHPRTEALKTSAAALCRSHHQFVSAQRLFED